MNPSGLNAAQRRQLRNLQRLLLVMSWASVALAIGWGCYLVLTPTEQFLSNPVWRPALSAVPNQDPDLLGIALLVLGALLALGNHEQLRPLAWFGYVLGVSAWLLLAGSFSYAAAQNGGVGSGNVLFYLFAATVLTGLAYARHD